MRAIVGKAEMDGRLQKWLKTKDNPKREKENDEQYEKRLSSIGDYEYAKKLGSDFSKRLGIGIHDALNWREQQWLAGAAYDLQMLGQYDKLLEFANKYKINGLKTFLSCEFDIKNGQKILNIGDKLNLEDAQKVFAKTAEIIDLAEKESEELAEMFFQDSNQNIDMSKVKYELLEKANEIIVRLGEKIGGRKGDIKEYISDIDNSKIEIMLLSAALKDAKKQGVEIKWEDIKNFNLDIKDFGSDLNEEEKQEMLVVAERNWVQNEKLKDAVVDGFKKSLENSQNQKWYVCKFQGKIVSFVRFEKTDRGTLYAGSFNVDPEARGVGVGEEMMNRALIEEGKENILEATASPRNVVGTCYVEKVGFILDGYVADYHKTGEPLFSMRLDKEKNKNYYYRNEGKENAISEEQIKKQCWTQENLDQIVGAETIVLKFDMKNEFEKMNSAMEKLLIAKDDNGRNVSEQNLKNKYVVTRYFQDNKNDKENNLRYFVFEKIK